MIPEDKEVDKALRSSSHGDKAAYAVVVQWCRERLLAYCRSRLRYEDLRSGYQDDLMSDVLLAFWLELNKFPDNEELTSLVAWLRLRREAKSLACDRYRAENAQKRRPSGGIRNLYQEQHSPSVEAEGLLDLEIIDERDKFLSGLKDRDRKLVELRCAGVDVETIALELQFGSSTIYNRLQALEHACRHIND